MAKVKDGVFITNEKDVSYLLSLEEKDLTISLIIELIGKFNGKRRFNPYDYLRVPPGVYGPEGHKNKNEGVTTVGLWIFNRLCIEKDLFHVLGYVNKEITNGVYKDMKKTLSYARLEEDIPLEALKRFLLKSQLLMRLTTVLAAHYSDDMLMLSEKLEPLKKKLIAENREALENGDEVVAESIEKQLIAKTKELLKDDDAMEIFDCGARGNIPNNLKNMCMMKGAVFNSVSGKYEIATSNYMDGISKEEYHIFANSIAPGSVSRAIKTQVGGYWEKLILAAFSHVKIGPKDSDCGTKRHIEVVLDKSNIDDWMYSYIIEGKELVEITSKTRSKYMGKKVKIRYASMCESEGDLCERCCGTLFRRIGIENVGMAMPRIASTIKQRALKGFHDSTVKTTDVGDILDKVFSMPKPKIKI